ncbi:LPXTG cell wall anchor domain-containing protein [Lactococcus petauri]|uniref:LPXTG cell wall anchor domain-containing protein n=1 Tax=Lactococcus formosensis TaxID=1281486 RepID=A0A9X4PF36_9LACT|nr:LPXTG cell wall anchor domain-containing protein [Lactococcus formosensis]MDG6194551.1 LPXTG cell wall anchor domain-containing protein [Lactococcus formosensis]
MSATNKMNLTSGITGAGLTMLPTTGDKVSSILPIIGGVMLLIVLAFTVYNFLLKKWYSV